MKKVETEATEAADERRPEYDLKSLRVRRLGPARKRFGDVIKPEKEIVRNRIEKEDTLLNSRTSIFLTVNGLWVAAVLISTDLNGRVIVAFVGTIISFLWVMCLRKTQKVISELTKEYRREAPDDPVERIVQEALGHPAWWRPRPTTILGIYLPWLSFLAWL